jgi:hypothetical protein
MSHTTTDLYRAIKNGTFNKDVFVVNEEAVPGLLHPRFQATTYLDKRGQQQTSQADVTVYERSSGDEVDSGGGTSMFNVEGWFGFSDWKYFHVPEGTEYPVSLLLIKKGKSKRTNKTGELSGYHYQIEPRNRMTVDAYKGALDNLARNAVVMQIKLAKGR